MYDCVKLFRFVDQSTYPLIFEYLQILYAFVSLRFLSRFNFAAMSWRFFERSDRRSVQDVA